MSEAIYVAASGALVQEMRLEVLSNNLANINTTGFKEDRTVFRAYLPGTSDFTEENLQEGFMLDSPGALPPFLPSNYYVRFEGSRTDFAPGQLRLTGNKLDMALEGSGFFCIDTPEGTRYTRQGTFALNQEGVLVTQDGYPVLGQAGRINIDTESTDLNIDEEGNIWVDGSQIDTIKIVDFPQPYELEKTGTTLFVPTETTVTEIPAEDVKVSQGFIELSNVSAVRVMTEMIEVLRAYESYQKVIQSVDDATSKAIDEVGTVA